jgi:hypothetical protein
MRAVYAKIGRNSNTRWPYELALWDQANQTQPEGMAIEISTKLL